MSIHTLTTQQGAVLAFIKDYAAEHRYQPSYEEIMAHMGFASKNAVTVHIKALERKGYVRRNPGQPRAIVILK